MFFDDRTRSLARRRGVVLILVLGMLALMALIGVTFATFAGQSLVSNRNFAQSVSFPTSEQVMDYALAQLINDTNNPTSALRGHSLTRDMYGRDSLLSGNTAESRGQITRLPGGVPLSLTAVNLYSTWSNLKPVDLRNQFQYVTNIPVFSLNPALYNADFTRWILHISSGGNGNVASTYEILEDDFSTVNSPFHVFTLAPTDPQTSVVPNPINLVVTRTYAGADQPYVYNDPNPVHILRKSPVVLNTAAPLFPPNNVAVNFTLDGRYMHAFNGSGMTRHNPAGVPYNNAAYANFRTNGNLLAHSFNNGIPYTSTLFGDPDAIGMDEDYDACDLENWYLALQSADGQVMIPSFHRPGILTALDWTNTYLSTNTPAQNALGVMSMSKILRPRAVDNSPLFPPDPIPDSTGHIKYDIDNDGDGITDSVWLDLGFPPQRDGRGLTFKPLFAFMVIGLNGRLPLNTVGNLQSRDMQAKTSATAAAPYVATPAPFNYEYGPQNFLDGSTWSHTSHLGFSVNEINPLFALQNASDIASNPNHLTAANPGGTILYTQHDNSAVVQSIQGNNITTPGAMVDVVQLRNLLAGTVPQNSLTNPTARA